MIVPYFFAVWSSFTETARAAMHPAGATAESPVRDLRGARRDARLVRLRLARAAEAAIPRRTSSFHGAASARLLFNGPQPALAYRVAPWNELCRGEPVYGR